MARFNYAFKGIFYAIKNDSSFRQQFYGVGGFLLVFIFIFKSISKEELLFVVLAYILILITELQNSSFEAALDRIHPEHHEEIGRSKDMAAGAVLTAGFFLLFVLIVIVL